MKDERTCRSGHHYKHGRSLQIFLKRLITAVVKQWNHKKGNKELQGLSEHLLDDLGFARNGQPLHWSSCSPEQATPEFLRPAGKGQAVCKQRLVKQDKIACHYCR